MKKYFLTRLALALPVILLVSVFSFALVFLAPGDPAAQYRTLEMTDARMALPPSTLIISSSV